MASNVTHTDCPECRCDVAERWPATWQEHLDAWLRGVGPQLKCRNCGQVFAEPWSTVPALATAFWLGFAVASAAVSWAVIRWYAALGV